MKALLINKENWEDIATESNRWYSVLQKQLRFGEEQIQTLTEEKTSRHKGRSPDDTATIRHTCICCGRVCLSCISLVSHSQYCSKSVNMTSRPSASYMFSNDWRRYACVSYECSPYVLHRPCWHWYASLPFTTPLSWSHGIVNWIHTSECCSSLLFIYCFMNVNFDYSFLKIFYSYYMLFCIICFVSSFYT